MHTKANTLYRGHTEKTECVNVLSMLAFAMGDSVQKPEVGLTAKMRLQDPVEERRDLLYYMAHSKMILYVSDGDLRRVTD